MAGVVMRFEGSLSGTGLLSLEPEDALAWLRTGGEAEDESASPIDRFVERGASLIGGAVTELARSARRAAEPGDASLEERPLPAALRATHAPPDTVVLSVSAELAARELRVPIGVHLLFEPKVLDGLLTVLSQSDSASDSSSI